MPKQVQLGALNPSVVPVCAAKDTLFALALFVEALTADAVHFVVANYGAAGTVKPPATCPPATVAITAFWRRGLHQAQFTFRTRHAVPLRWKACTRTYSMQQYCTALYCTPTGAWLVRGKACVNRHS